MKKIYMTPVAAVFNIQTSGMLALSTQRTTVTSDNAEDFEVLTNKKSGPWGEDQKKGPWDNM